MFVVDKEWEINSPSAKASWGDGHRLYPLIETSPNTFIFVVSIGSGGEVQTFLLDRIRNLLDFINHPDINNVKVSLLSRRCDNTNGQHAICDLDSIKVGSDKEGNIAYAFYCLDGAVYIDSLTDLGEKDLVDLKVVFSIDD